MRVVVMVAIFLSAINAYSNDKPEGTELEFIVKRVMAENASKVNSVTFIRNKVVGENKWIEVDISKQVLTAWVNGEMLLTTPISSGSYKHPTPTGEFRIWIKLLKIKMEGGSGNDYYYVPDVPYVMFFAGKHVSRARGFSLHGAYWHNDFGRRRSHGCINLPPSAAEKIFYWANPPLFGKKNARATRMFKGTKVIIHN